LAAHAQRQLHYFQAGIAALHPPSIKHAAAAQANQKAAGQPHLQNPLLQQQQQHGQLGMPQSHQLQNHVHNQLQLQQHGQQASSPLPAVQKHEGCVPQAVSPLPQAQVLRHRQQPDLLKEKDKGIKGILSFAHLASSRVAPNNAPQEVSSLSSGAALPRNAEGTEDESTLSSRVSSIGNIHAIRKLKTGIQGTPKMARSTKYRKPKRLLMRVALQQSVQQVKACTSQLEEQQLQQQAMQKTLQIMTTNCGIIFDRVLQMQQQRTSG